MRWISVRNWRKFQHYDPAKRQPRWIKVYTDLLDRPEYRALAGRHRGLLHDIWMLYARTRCELPASPSYIARACGYPTEWESRRRGDLTTDSPPTHHALTMHSPSTHHALTTDSPTSADSDGEGAVRQRDLERLCRAGFIEFVASPTLAEGHAALASRAPARSLEVEVEKERTTRAVPVARPPAPEPERNGTAPDEQARETIAHHRDASEAPW